MAGVEGRVFAKDEQFAPNCLTNIDPGTTASTRIGNMVAPKFLTVKGVVCAATLADVGDAETTDKLEAGSATKVTTRFVRTSVRIMIVRDKSMNEKGYVSYEDVFEPPMQTSMGGAGPESNPFLWNRKLNTLGRYEILKSGEFTLDQTDPQKSFTWLVPCGGIPIRFNGNVTARASWVS